MALLRTKTGDFAPVQRVGCVRSLSRKRILIRSASLMEDFSGSDFDFDCKAEMPMKKLCGEGGDAAVQCTDKSVLESLPLDVLIKIISGVNHEDLNQLFEVSEIISQAAKVAREFHFAFTTPTKVAAFRTPISPMEFLHNEEEAEPPNAPLRKPGRRRFVGKKKTADISVALFASDTEDS
ncbi:hypothetical protein V2J09_019565 [Rumex salicifolius]